MILLCGIPSEQPLAMVAEALTRRRAPCVLFNQRRFAGMELEFDLSGGQITGELSIGDNTYRLEDFLGVYIRLMDDQFLPELKNEPEDSHCRQYARRLHTGLMRWCEVAPCRVVNRTAAMASNFSKPYQTQLIREHGFAVPETLITNDPELVREFLAQHHRVIYKSISGIRSIAQLLEAKDLSRLDSIRWCPTQFQVYVEGINVRAHTVGAQVFATLIHSEATDYRYARQQTGTSAVLEAITLPDELAERCVRLAAALELPFAGIDLKIAPDDQVYCFEVNPSPAFSYYQAQTGQPIAEAVAEYLVHV